MSHRQEVGVFFRSLKGFKRWLAGTSAALMLAAGSGAVPKASAQEKPDINAVLQRLESLEKQNQELKQKTQELQQKLEETQPVILDRAGAITTAVQGQDKDTDAAGFKKRLDEYM